MAQLDTPAPHDETLLPVSPASRRKRNPNGSTGPKTPGGKAIVSRNATTHGCNIAYKTENGRLTEESRERLIIDGESQADWDALHERWIADYQPDSELADALVLNVALAEWGWGRATRRYDELEHSLQKQNVLTWTAEHYAQLDRFLRYQTRGERTFYRARAALEAWRREGKRDGERQVTRAEKITVQPAAGPGKDSRPAAAATPRTAQQAALVQCITVQVVDGETRTLFQPKSEAFAQILRGMASLQPVVKRAIYFTCDPPAEYHWLASGPAPKLPFHVVLERTAEEALEDLERERVQNSPHVLEVL